ncbi:MAG: transmembrane 220 family protein [Granulosicoccus sp.]|nr:transmembrane 220 family protein [Granulosicoccus sp.]
MRFLNGFMMLLMLMCAGVQYNDPDGVLWMAIYAVPSFWCAVGVFHPQSFNWTICRWGLIVSLLGSCFGVMWFWPEAESFWQKSVWFETEAAREGMGMMIVAIVLLITWLTSPKPGGRSTTAMTDC